MVAYSFRSRFRDPIMVGLGKPVLCTPLPHPKRQTIRAFGKRRHVEPGQKVQLYTGMRTKHCDLIGEAVCRSRRDVSLQLQAGVVWQYGIGTASTASLLDRFAREDGFADWSDLVAFWAEQHPGVYEFFGTLISWEPL